MKTKNKKSMIGRRVSRAWKTAMLGAALVVLGFGIGAGLTIIHAFTGPGSQSAGTGSGALGTNSANNVSVGTSTPLADTKFSVKASSTDTSNYALRVFQNSDAPVFWIRNDGSIMIATSTVSAGNILTVQGSIYSTGGIVGTVAASNVTADVFGAGNFAFPSSLGINTSTQVSLPANLTVYGTSQFTQTTTFSGGVVVNGVSSTVLANTVSIGTSTQTFGLHVEGTTRFTGGSVGITDSEYNGSINNGYVFNKPVSTGNIARITFSNDSNQILIERENSDSGVGGGIKRPAGGTGFTTVFSNTTSTGGVALETSGTLRLWVDAGTGNVGIGSSTYPSANTSTLSVEGETKTRNLIIYGLAGATGCLSVNSSGGVTTSTCSGGSGITSLNTLTGATQTFSTSTALASGFDIRSSGTAHTWYLANSLSQISGLATTTGNIIVGNTANGWSALTVGTNGKVLTASSTATNGVSWETASGGSLSGGTANWIPMWTGPSTLGTSTLLQNGVTTYTLNGFAIGTSTTQTAGNIFVTGSYLGGAVAGSQVSADVFGAGNFSFPSSLGINTSTNASLPAELSVYGNIYATGNVYGGSKPVPFVFENPGATEDDSILIFDTTSTITNIYAVNKTHGDTVTFNLVWDPSRNKTTSTARHLFSSNQTVTATTTPQSGFTLASTTVNAGSVLRFVTSAASSSQFTFTLYYKDAPQ